MSLPKPELRGLGMKAFKGQFVQATLLAGSVSGLWYYFVCYRKEKKYEEFWKTYDADKDYERMKKAGVFQSVRPDGSVGEGW